MAKKVTVTVLSVLIVACSAFGLYSYFDSNNTDVDDSKQTQETTNIDTTEPVSEATDMTQEPTNKEPVNEQPSDTIVELTSSVYTIMGVHDNQADMDVQPRVVFGKGYIQSECYLKFDDNGEFDLYISGFSGIEAHGTYTVKDDIISITLSDGSIAEYDIKRNYEGEIDSIVVPLNEYSVFFWN